jgi:hypothetical protein
MHVIVIVKYRKWKYSLPHSPQFEIVGDVIILLAFPIVNVARKTRRIWNWAIFGIS